MITSINEFKNYQSGLAKRAYTELCLIGMLNGEYNSEMSKCILDLCELFGTQGHSGFTASYAIELFTKLAQNKALSPLTNNPAEWEDMSSYSDDKPGTLYQNKRDCTVFSYDQLKTWKSVDEKLIIEKINKVFESTYPSGYIHILTSDGDELLSGVSQIVKAELIESPGVRVDFQLDNGCYIRVSDDDTIYLLINGDARECRFDEDDTNTIIDYINSSEDLYDYPGVKPFIVEVLEKLKLTANV